MQNKSMDSLWREYCLKENMDADKAPSKEFQSVFEHFKAAIESRDSKLALAEKSLDKYQIHNHTHLKQNHDLALENGKLKRIIEANSLKVQVKA